MRPITFPGHNIVMGADQPQYQPLPALSIENQVISCWELTPEDIAKITETGVIWLSQLTFGQPLQPQIPSADQPFTFIPEEKIADGTQD